MIRRPESIKKGNTIGITAPSFGAATEPYSVLIDIAIIRCNCPIAVVRTEFH